jgi:rubrerythrin
MNFSEILVNLVGQREIHARFVNTLSLLEYIGARKILKSQEAQSLSMQILAHATEELRHAQILKGLALQLSEGVLDNYTDEQLLCSREARAYLHAVDGACAESLGERDSRKNYTMTTLLVEERAMKIYPEYERILKVHHINNAVRSIIKDEDKHLSEMQEELNVRNVGEPELSRLRSIEEMLFAKFVSVLSSEVRFRSASLRPSLAQV